MQVSTFSVIMSKKITRIIRRLRIDFIITDDVQILLCCRNSAHIRVCFWRHVRFGSILFRCFFNSKRK